MDYKIIFCYNECISTAGKNSSVYRSIQTTAFKITLSYTSSHTLEFAFGFISNCAQFHFRNFEQRLILPFLSGSYDHFRQHIYIFICFIYTFLFKHYLEKQLRKHEEQQWPSGKPQAGASQIVAPLHSCSEMNVQIKNCL